jgi:hypothetical protein
LEQQVFIPISHPSFWVLFADRVCIFLLELPITHKIYGTIDMVVGRAIGQSRERKHMSEGWKLRVMCAVSSCLIVGVAVSTALAGGKVLQQCSYGKCVPSPNFDCTPCCCTSNGGVSFICGCTPGGVGAGTCDKPTGPWKCFY